jgi:hypothetical protein
MNGIVAGASRGTGAMLVPEVTMRTIIVSACCALAVAFGASAAAQSPEKDSQKPPANGDEVVVKGCLRDSTLESTDVGRKDREPLPMAYTFQLKGKKELLKELREKYDNQRVDLVGILKSNLANDKPGKDFGRARVVIGAGSNTPGAVHPMAMDQPMPVLEVKGFEGTGIACGR